MMMCQAFLPVNRNCERCGYPDRISLRLTWKRLATAALGIIVRERLITIRLTGTPAIIVVLCQGRADWIKQQLWTRDSFDQLDQSD